MVIALWIVNALLALAMLAAGTMKLARPKPALAQMGLKWVEDFSPGFIKTIAALEVIGALGLVLPLLTGIAPILSPIAAVGLLVLMVGATVIHLRRHEPPVSIALAVLAAASAVLGFVVVLG